MIAFNIPQTESPLLKLNDTFKVKFLESGHFYYQCQIITRMKGSIEVYEDSLFIG